MHAINDKTNPYSSTEEYKKMMMTHNMTVTDADARVAVLPNTYRSMIAYNWFNNVLSCIGDMAPNSENEIHLDKSC